jgi:hypothetical protein
MGENFVLSIRCTLNEIQKQLRRGFLLTTVLAGEDGCRNKWFNVVWLLNLSEFSFINNSSTS